MIPVTLYHFDLIGQIHGAATLQAKLHNVRSFSHNYPSIFPAVHDGEKTIVSCSFPNPAKYSNYREMFNNAAFAILYCSDAVCV